MSIALLLLFTLDAALALSGRGLLPPSAIAARARPAVAKQPSLAKLQETIRLAEGETKGQLQTGRTLVIVGPVVAFAAGVIAATSGSLDGLLLPPAQAAPVVAQVLQQPAQQPDVELTSVAVVEAPPAPAAMSPSGVSPALAGEEAPELVPAMPSPSLFDGARAESPVALLLTATTQPLPSLALTADAPPPEELQKESEEAKRETIAADLRRKQRLRVVAAERASNARERQREADEMAQAVRADTRPLLSTQLASEVRKQKRMDERSLQGKSAAAERQAAVDEAMRRAELQVTLSLSLTSLPTCNPSCP
jgi:hypothetical protein